MKIKGGVLMTNQENELFELTVFGYRNFHKC